MEEGNRDSGFGKARAFNGTETAACMEFRRAGLKGMWRSLATVVSASLEDTLGALTLGLCSLYRWPLLTGPRAVCSVDI